jgi:hypothetical protein
VTRILAYRRSALGLLLAISSAVAGCGVDISGIMSPDGCTNKTTVSAELLVDSSDARYIWAVDLQTGAPISLRIPGGYGVASSPDAIVDPAGQEVGRTGDELVSGCMVQNALLIDESDIRRVGE